MLLTDELLEKLEPENEIYHIFPENRYLDWKQWDRRFGVNAIFGVAVNPDKSIAFVLRYAEEGSKIRDKHLGYWPTLSLNEAKELALKFRGHIRSLGYICDLYLSSFKPKDSELRDEIKRLFETYLFAAFGRETPLLFLTENHIYNQIDALLAFCADKEGIKTANKLGHSLSAANSYIDNDSFNKTFFIEKIGDKRPLTLEDVRKTFNYQTNKPFKTYPLAINLMILCGVLDVSSFLAIEHDAVSFVKGVCEVDMSIGNIARKQIIPLTETTSALFKEIMNTKPLSTNFLRLGQPAFVFSPEWGTDRVSYMMSPWHNEMVSEMRRKLKMKNKWQVENIPATFRALAPQTGISIEMVYRLQHNQADDPQTLQELRKVLLQWESFVMVPTIS